MEDHTTALLFVHSEVLLMFLFNMDPAGDFNVETQSKVMELLCSGTTEVADTTRYYYQTCLESGVV